MLTSITVYKNVKHPEFGIDSFWGAWNVTMESMYKRVYSHTANVLFPKLREVSIHSLNVFLYSIF